MSVFGIRIEFLDVYTPKTSISASAVCVICNSMKLYKELYSFFY